MASDRKTRTIPSPEERRRRRLDEARAISRRFESLLAANNPDEPLLVEELQIISILSVGGFGERAAVARTYPEAMRLIVPTVPFRIADMRDTRVGKNGMPMRQRRGRPSVLALHNKTHGRCRLYRGILWAATEALLTVRKEDRNAFRREQRRAAALAKSLERVNAPDLAAELRTRTEIALTAHRRNVQQRRARVKEVTDDFAVNVRGLLTRYTTLHGGHLDSKIGVIMSALNLGSPEPTAVRQRFTRMRHQAETTDRQPG